MYMYTLYVCVHVCVHVCVCVCVRLLIALSRTYMCMVYRGSHTVDATCISNLFTWDGVVAGCCAITLKECVHNIL